MNQKNQLSKIFITFLVSCLLYTQVLLVPATSVLAIDIPTAPSAPSVPVVTEPAITVPSAPPVPKAPGSENQTPKSSPSPEIKSSPIPSAPTVAQVQEQQQEQLDASQQAKEERAAKREQAKADALQQQQQAAANLDVAATSEQGDVSGAQDASHANGDPFITTGDANASALLTNNANNNLDAAGSVGGGAAAINNGNGANSASSADINTTNNSTTITTNEADVHNALDLGAVSGQNESSFNVGDAAIVSGNANTTATVINGINSNIDGVVVAEFNVNDNHTGDVVLAFPQSSTCTATVCNSGATAQAQNTNNGANSTNNSDVTTTNNNSTFQNNSADVTNDIVLVADSGNNETDFNTNGNNSIKTGDANVVATVGNFVNTNISGAGNVLIGVVNVFGNLVGNIIVPDSTASTSNGGTLAANNGNGSSSTNESTITNTNNSVTSQTNDAVILNNLTVGASTGNNTVGDNTAGQNGAGNQITTGDSSVDVNAVTIANSNVADGDTWYLVFVNDASGNWSGHIVGSPEGAQVGGSAGTEFVMTPDGTIIAQNSGNGSNSANANTVTTTNNNTLVQNNQATITNNLNLQANSGNNSASKNTGGENSIETGDAHVMANIVNFINNNFVGGKVVVSVVNVFGSWLGNFVTPGQDNEHVAVVGGVDVSSVQNSNSNTSTASQDSNTVNDVNTTISETVTQVSQNSGQVAGVSNILSQSAGGASVETVAASGDPSKNVQEDTTIQVPVVTPHFAGVNRVVPDWFWIAFLVSVCAVISRKLYRKFHKKEIAVMI